jgi:hypothetical protein
MEDGMTPSTALSGIDDRVVADTALVVEALAAFAGPADDLETYHERRAWELITTCRFVVVLLVEVSITLRYPVAMFDGLPSERYPRS